MIFNLQKINYDNSMYSLGCSKTKTKNIFKHVMGNFKWNFMIYLNYENIAKHSFSNQPYFFYAIW